MEYKYIIVPIITLIVAQLIKFTIESIRDKKLRFDRLFNGSGGMPSTHNALVYSLTFMIGFNEGFSSILFAVGLVFSLIVSYDAMSIRLESGKQANAINLIVEELMSNSQESIKKLKDKLGHYPIEVLSGIILGLLSSLFFTYVIFI